MTLFPLTHKQLVESAYKWVMKNASCGVAFKELYTSNIEYADVIGFGSWGRSVLIECKASRSDFLADKKKSFRINPETGMGSVRYYCCPSGLIKESELPVGWGLLYVDDKLKCKAVHKPTIEINTENYSFKQEYRHEKNIIAEHSLMYSALRRLQLRGRMHEIYEVMETPELVTPK